MVDKIIIDNTVYRYGIHACVKTKQYTELAIKMAIKNNTIYENSYWNYNENWCPIKENKCDALF